MKTEMRGQRNRIRLCLDEVRGGEVSGRMYTLYDTRPIPFVDTWDLMRAGEALFDRLQYPQRALKRRSFLVRRGETGPAPGEPCATLEQLAALKGRAGSYWLAVDSRYAATWQGVLLEDETGRRGNFSSELELYRLLAGWHTKEEGEQQA